MFRRLYNWVISLAASPYAVWALAAVSFTESSFFPVPPDVLLLPMALSRPDKALFYAGVCTISSVLGGLAGYAIGAMLYDSVGQWLIAAYGYGDNVEAFRQAYAQYGEWIILLKGITPIPYKLVTITSGFAGYDIFWFMVLSLITRGLRFYILAGLMHRYGNPMRSFIEKHFGLVLGVLAFFVIAGFAAVKFII
ncbi:YqaA family protein [Pseudochelatococcus contaminans]|uniref:Membrane protein YqaA with SNARE-associated domain n=1 Tax=Pseudochelatococcus contaminans TaxID=1538103 RepID=A0A7W6EGZ4_9HYPH|nr:YqaA family protein [Pseudochelatococcus contaminans]MBB3809748.1 membrane protein YqaA with SNARE-associated domain [Pseudochelatococcus contaminans]